MKKIFVCLILLLVTLTACTDQKEEKKGYDISQNKWDNETLDNNLRADFEAESVEKAYKYHARLTDLPVDKIKKIFMGWDTSSSTIEQEDTGDGITKWLYTEQGTEIGSNWENTIATTKDYSYYDNCLWADSDAFDVDGKATAKLGTTEELDFLKKKDVEKKVRLMFDELDLGFEVHKITFQTLTAPYLNNLREKAKEDLEKKKDEETENPYVNEDYLKKWKKSEGAYYLTIEFSNADIVISNNGNGSDLSDNTYIFSFEAQMIYNQKGCVYLNLPCVIKKEEESAEETKLISVADAVQSLKKDMTSIILTDDNLISEGKLQYLPIGTLSSQDLELLPMWVFKIQTNAETEKAGKKKTITSSSYVYVDGSTGKVLH